MRTLTIAVAVLASFTANAHAWNQLGHKVVAEIAWRQLTPEQRQPIVEAIRRVPTFDRDFVAKMDDDAAKGDKAAQDHWIFLQASAWPDVIREDKERDRPSWHYIDFPIYLAESDRMAFANRLPINIATDYPGSIRRDKYNAVQAIQLAKATLRSNVAPGVKGMAYCWLFHLTGDLHQPLHCSALFDVSHFPKGDKGGNLIKLAGGENLHSRWDGLIGKSARMANVSKLAVELSDKRRYGEEWETAAKELDPAKWADEGHKLCESVVYDTAILDAVRNTPAGMEVENVQLPESYNKAAGELVRKRMLIAGLRLAAVLKVPGM